MTSRAAGVCGVVMTAHDRMEADDPLVRPRHTHDSTVKICRPAGCLYAPWTKLRSLRVCAHSWGDTCVRLQQQGVGKIHADPFKRYISSVILLFFVGKNTKYPCVLHRCLLPTPARGLTAQSCLRQRCIKHPVYKTGPL